MIDNIVDYIAAALPEAAATELLLFKCRFILSEYISNAIKHVRGHASLIAVGLRPDGLHIELSTTGEVLHLPAYGKRPALTWPLPSGHLHEKWEVYGDDVNVLYVTAGEPNCAVFMAEERLVVPRQVRQLHEHFGLLIIAAAAKEFTYHYDPDSGRGTFRALLPFG